MPYIAGFIVALALGGVVGYSLHPATPDSAKQQSSAVSNAATTTAEWKIPNAMSAAPESISSAATVLDWPASEGAQPTELKKGTNEWTCFPNSPETPSNDPICVDKQSMQWFGAYLSKTQPKITQSGIAYMLQGGGTASNADPFAKTPPAGEHWMVEPPHIMVFPAGQLDEKVYGVDHSKGSPWVMWAGTPYEHLMVPVE